MHSQVSPTTTARFRSSHAKYVSQLEAARYPRTNLPLYTTVWYENGTPQIALYYTPRRISGQIEAHAQPLSKELVHGTHERRVLSLNPNDAFLGANVRTEQARRKNLTAISHLKNKTSPHHTGCRCETFGCDDGVAGTVFFRTMIPYAEIMKMS